MIFDYFPFEVDQVHSRKVGRLAKKADCKFVVPCGALVQVPPGIPVSKHSELISCPFTSVFVSLRAFQDEFGSPAVFNANMWSRIASHRTANFQAYALCAR